MDAAAELGRNPVSKHQIQPKYENEQAGAGQNCRTRLARPIKFSGANADKGNIYFFRVQLTTCRIGNLTRSIHTLAICVTIQHTETTSEYVYVSPSQYTAVEAGQGAPRDNNNQRSAKGRNNLEKHIIAGGGIHRLILAT